MPKLTATVTTELRDKVKALFPDYNNSQLVEEAFTCLVKCTSIIQDGVRVITYGEPAPIPTEPIKEDKKKENNVSMTDKEFYDKLIAEGKSEMVARAALRTKQQDESRGRGVHAPKPYVPVKKERKIVCSGSRSCSNFIMTMETKPYYCPEHITKEA